MKTENEMNGGTRFNFRTSLFVPSFLPCFLCVVEQYKKGAKKIRFVLLTSEESARNGKKTTSKKFLTAILTRQAHERVSTGARGEAGQGPPTFNTRRVSNTGF